MQENYREKLRKSIIFTVLLVALFGCKEQVVHNLSESDANRFLTKLHEMQIDGEKVKQPDGRWALAVEEDDALAAIKVLEESRLLRDINSAPPEKSSVISSREDQRFRFERALSREIENTLTSIEGVLEARVHLNMPVTDPLFGTPLKNSKSSASVLMVVRDGINLTKEEVAALVSGASGVDATTISVLISRPTQTQPVSPSPTQLEQLAPAENQAEVAASTTAPQPVEATIVLPRPGVKTSTIVQIVVSVLILLGGGVWLYKSRAKPGPDNDPFDTPLIK